MLYSDKNDDVAFDKPRDTPEDQLRHLERQHRWHAQPWHFELVKHIAPVRVHGFFGLAKLDAVRKVLYFNGGTPNGKTAFDFVKKNLWLETYRALGNLEVRLAHDGEILNSFLINPKRDMPGFLKDDEVKLMFDLSHRAMKGQKFDAIAELAKHREAHHGSR